MRLSLKGRGKNVRAKTCPTCKSQCLLTANKTLFRNKICSKRSRSFVKRGLVSLDICRRRFLVNGTWHKKGIQRPKSLSISPCSCVFLLSALSLMGSAVLVWAKAVPAEMTCRSRQSCTAISRTLFATGFCD